MGSDRGPINYVDLQNPLFIHPSDEPSSLRVREKLTRAVNYRTWKQSMEIRLSTMHKLEFVLWHSSKAK